MTLRACRRVLICGLTFIFLYGGISVTGREVHAQSSEVTVPKQNIKILRARDYLNHLTHTFWRAENEILIASMLVSDRRSRTMAELFNVLTQRARNGVSIRVIVAGKYNFGRFNKEAMKTIHETDNMRTRAYVGEGLMHSKFIVVDGEAVYNGSANFTSSGIGRTEETTLFLENEQLAGRFKDYFDELWIESIGYYELKERLGL